MVTAPELFVGVDITLGSAAVTNCPSFDIDGNGKVTVNERSLAVNNALGGCDGWLTRCWAGAFARKRTEQVTEADRRASSGAKNC
jgi:hypothetical protein